jgi:hypothetical protein
MHRVAVTERHLSELHLLEADTLKEEIVAWCREQFGRDPVLSNISWGPSLRRMAERRGEVFFEDITDAIFFKLRWV